jgi:hypothetical protein
VAAVAVLYGICTGERENEPEREERGGELRGIQEQPQESSQRLKVGGGIGVFLGAPRTCFQLEEEDDVHLHITPWTFRFFLGKCKTTPFCLFGD